MFYVILCLNEWFLFITPEVAQQAFDSHPSYIIDNNCTSVMPALEDEVDFYKSKAFKPTLGLNMPREESDNKKIDLKDDNKEEVKFDTPTNEAESAPKVNEKHCKYDIIPTAPHIWKLVSKCQK